MTKPTSPSSGWLLLVYRVPSSPSRLRAQVWRRVRRMGAVYLQQAVVALPDEPDAEQALRRLQGEITSEMGGEAQLFRSDALAGENQVIARMNAARDEEYAEIVSRSDDFLAEIERETSASHFTYAELEENEEDLVKLRRWLDKVCTRDRFGATGRTEAVGQVEACGVALERFADRVYTRDTQSEE